VKSGKNKCIGRVAILTPAFFPQVCGVGDYTANLIKSSKRFADASIISWSGRGQYTWGGHTVIGVDGDENTLDHVLSIEEFNVLIVQFASLGFGELGKKTDRLIESILRWRSREATNKVLVFIHETWVWELRSILHLLLVRRQKKFVSSIVRVSDFVLTNNITNRKHIKTLAGIDVPVIPVPANIEMDPNRCMDQLAKYEKARSSGGIAVVVFGMPEKRIKTIKNHRRSLEILEENGLLGRVEVIGKGLLENDRSAQEYRLLRKYIPVEKIKIRGVLPLESVQKVLCKSHVMLTYYNTKEAGKSGVIKAAMSHGMVVLSSKKIKWPGSMDFRMLKKALKSFKGDEPQLMEYFFVHGMDGKSYYELECSWERTVRAYNLAGC